MEKKEIIQLLDEKIDALVSFLDDHPDNEFAQIKISGKWTAGQHVVHLIKSMRLLNNALRIPKFILRYRFGRMNRSERSYQGLVKRYQEKLENVVGTFAASAPGDVINKDKSRIIRDLKKEKQRLISKINRLSESTLSTYILPHPLIGKLSLREMMYFTCYHTEHHHEILKKYY